MAIWRPIIYAEMESPCKSKQPFTTFAGMKQVSPILKFLSWFWPIRLERRSSPFNRVLDVDLSHGHLQLNTRQANYSFGRLHTVMEKSLARIHRDNQTYNEVLMLGYGGGCLQILMLLGRLFRMYLMGGTGWSFL